MVFCVWSLYDIPLEFEFHALGLGLKLGLEVKVCFQFYLLASLTSFFLLTLIGPHQHEYHEEFLEVPVIVLHLVPLLCPFILFRVFLPSL